MTGKLIMFDGPDGVGKTTQVALAKQWLGDLGHEVYTTRSHGGTPLGEELRKVSFMDIKRDPLTDHYISMAIHNELRNDIEDRRASGQTVLVDRSILSNWAYQVFGSGVVREAVEQDLDKDMHAFAPDLVICYEASLATLKQHIGKRGGKSDYFESKPDDYFERVIEGYRFAAQRYHATIIDASGTIQEVQARTMAAIKGVLPA